MKVKNLLIAFSLLIMFIAFSGVGYAVTCTLNLPTASSTISGLVKFNATLSELNENATRAVFYGRSSTTINSSYKILANVSNSTGIFLGNGVNVTIHTSGLLDSNDWQFYADCYNTSGAITTSTISSVTVNNTIPLIASISTPTLTKYLQTITFTTQYAKSYIVYVDNIAKVTGTITPDGTSQSQTATFQNKDKSEFYISASDSSDTNISATTSIVISLDDEEPIKITQRPTTQQDIIKTQQKENMNITIFIIIGFIIMMVIVMYVVLAQKKK